MKLKVFSIYDQKAEAYVRPFFAPTKGIALRSVLAALQDPQHDFNKYPADFTLFELGEWDDSTATWIPNDVKVNMGSIHELANGLTDSGRPNLHRIEVQKEEETTVN